MDYAKQLEEKEMELLNIQTLIISLEDQVQKVTDKNASLKNKEGELEKIIQKLEVELYHANIQKEEEKNQLRQELQQMQYEELQNELNQKLDELSRCQYQKKQLENKIARSETDFQERLNEITNNYAHFENEKSEFKKQLQDKEIVIKTQKNEITKINIVKKELDETRVTIIKLEEQIAQLTSEKNDLNVILKQKDSEKTSALESLKNELNKTINEILNEKNTLRVQLDNLLIEQKDLQNQHTNLNQLLQKTIKEKANLLTEHKTKDEAIQQLKKNFHFETNGLQNEIKQLKAQLTSKPISQSRTPKGQNMDLEEEFLIELAKKEHEIDELTEKVNKLEQEKKTSIVDLENIHREQLQKIHQEKHAIERSFNDKENNLNILLNTTNKEKTNLLNKLNELNASLENIVEEKKEIENKLKETEALRHSHMEYTKLQNELNILKNKYDELENQKERLLTNLQNKLDEKSNVLEDTQNTLNLKIQQIIDLNKSVQEYQQKLNHQNLARGISHEDIVRKEKELQQKETDVSEKYQQLKQKDIKIIELEHRLTMYKNNNVSTDDTSRVFELERKLHELQAGTNTRELERQVLLLTSKLNEKERLLSSINNSKYVKHLESKIQVLDKELDDLKKTKFKFNV
jgi:golgin subfamily B member 1